MGGSGWSMWLPLPITCLFGDLRISKFFRESRLFSNIRTYPSSGHTGMYIANPSQINIDRHFSNVSSETLESLLAYPQ